MHWSPTPHGDDAAHGTQAPRHAGRAASSRPLGRAARGESGGRPVRRGVRPRQRDPQRRRREERRREGEQVARPAGVRRRQADADAVGDRTAVDVGPGGARDVERRQRNADHRAPLFAPDDRRRTRRATEPGSIRAGVQLRAFDGGCPFQPRATVVGRPDDRAAFVAAADFGVADVRAVDVVGDVVAGHLVAGPRQRPPRAIRATASRASGRDPSLVTSAGPAARDA